MIVEEVEIVWKKHKETIGIKHYEAIWHEGYRETWEEPGEYPHWEIDISHEDIELPFGMVVKHNEWYDLVVKVEEAVAKEHEYLNV